MCDAGARPLDCLACEFDAGSRTDDGRIARTETIGKALNDVTYYAVSPLVTLVILLI